MKQINQSWTSSRYWVNKFQGIKVSWENWPTERTVQSDTDPHTVTELRLTDKPDHTRHVIPLQGDSSADRKPFVGAARVTMLRFCVSAVVQS